MYYTLDVRALTFENIFCEKTAPFWSYGNQNKTCRSKDSKRFLFPTPFLVLLVSYPAPLISFCKPFFGFLYRTPYILYPNSLQENIQQTLVILQVISTTSSFVHFHFTWIVNMIRSKGNGPHGAITRLEVNGCKWSMGTKSQGSRFHMGGSGVNSPWGQRVMTHSGIWNFRSALYGVFSL